MADEDQKTAPPTATTSTATAQVTVPRITIEFCTQCKWNLRAAYFAQELLQTFSTSLGEVALLPCTGGTFVIKLFHLPTAREQDGDRSMESKDDKDIEVMETVIWDRKVEGGFPETKELKNRVRNVVEPGRGLGHTDRALKKGKDEGRGEHAETKEVGRSAESKPGDKAAAIDAIDATDNA